MTLKYNLFTIIWACIMLCMTIIPGGDDSLNYAVFYDKIIHGVMFGVLTLLLIIGFSKQQTVFIMRFNVVVLSLVVANFYGLLIEITQIFIKNRGFEVEDLLANFTGTILGLGLFWLIYKS